MGKVVKHDLDEDEIVAVAAEVDALRGRTERIVAELETRVRDRYARLRRAVDVKAQVAAHPMVVASVGSVLAVALGISVFMSLKRRRAARRPMARLAGRVASYRALLADPERALRGAEPLGKRVIAAVLVAGATVIARGLGALFVKQAMGPRMLPARSAR